MIIEFKYPKMGNKAEVRSLSQPASFRKKPAGSLFSKRENIQLTGSMESEAVLIQDLDNDRDVDIIVINDSSPHDVFVNERL